MVKTPRPQPDALTDAEKAARRAKNAANRARREANQKERAAREAQKQQRAGKAAGKGQGDEKPKKPGKKAEEAPPPRVALPPKLHPAEAVNPDRFSVPDSPQSAPFHILIVAQAGRLEYQALLFAHSLRQNAPDWKGRLIVAEPRPEGGWQGHNTAISDAARAALVARGAEIMPFTAQHFGHSYPYGNKIEALALLPEGENFIFFDTDTLILGPLDRVPFDFTRPSASMQREGTWPQPPLYGPGYTEIWKSLYDRFGLDFDSSLDTTQPDEHWERYLYFNAGWFFGANPAEFGRRFLEWARAIRDTPGEALAAQTLEPWLDQIALPLVIHALGGGRPGPELAGLDGDITCHWRHLPLIYARESAHTIHVLENAAFAPDIKPLIENWKPARELIFASGGDALRPLINRDHLPSREQTLRQQIKKAGFWVV